MWGRVFSILRLEQRRPMFSQRDLAQNEATVTLALPYIPTALTRFQTPTILG